MTSTDADFAETYERLAMAIDQAGADNAAVYLAKVILLLAARLDKHAAIRSALAECLADH